MFVSGRRFVSHDGKLYFGETIADHAYYYDPNALTPSGSGRVFDVSSGGYVVMWEAIMGRPAFPRSGGSRANPSLRIGFEECFSGLFRWESPDSTILLFATPECLTWGEFPAAASDADHHVVIDGRLMNTNQHFIAITDGTAKGTRRIGPFQNELDHMVQDGSEVLFYAEPTDGPRGFYRLSPSDAAPRLAVDTRDARFTGPLVKMGGSYYGVAVDGARGSELWRTDGTPRGTKIVADLMPGADGSFPAELTPSFDTLYFTARSARGDELFRTDGRTIQLVRDIHPQGSASPAHLAARGRQLLFQADDGEHGAELWTTDGTAEGTRLVADLAHGRRSAHPRTMRLVGNEVVFWADDGAWGEALWREAGGKVTLITAISMDKPIKLDGLLDDWAAPYADRAIRDDSGDVGDEDAIDFSRIMLAVHGQDLMVAFRNGRSVDFRRDAIHYRVFFDVDRDAATGYRLDDPSFTVGAEYMLEGYTLYRYTGVAMDWAWQRVALGSYASGNDTVELRLRTDELPSGLVGSRVLAWGDNAETDDFASLDDDR